MLGAGLEPPLARRSSFELIGITLEPIPTKAHHSDTATIKRYTSCVNVLQIVGRPFGPALVRVPVAHACVSCTLCTGPLQDGWDRLSKDHDIPP